MQKPQKLIEWIFAGAIVFLGLLMAARGLLTLQSGSYEATAKYSGPYVLTGSAASFIGAAHLFAGVFFTAVLAAFLKLSRRTYIPLGAVGALGAVACSIGTFLVR